MASQPAFPIEDFERFTLRINVPVSYGTDLEQRKEFRIRFTDEQLFRSMIGSLASKAASARPGQMTPTGPVLVKLPKSAWSPSLARDTFGDDVLGGEPSKRDLGDDIDEIQEKSPLSTLKSHLLMSKTELGASWMGEQRLLARRIESLSNGPCKGMYVVRPPSAQTNARSGSDDNDDDDYICGSDILGQEVLGYDLKTTMRSSLGCFDEILKARRVTLDILEGKCEQPEMRDYAGIQQWAFKTYARYEREMAQLTAADTNQATRVGVRRAAIDKSALFRWSDFRQIIMDQLSYENRERFPGENFGLTPMLVYLEREKRTKAGGEVSGNKVRSVRNLADASVFEFSMLMAENAVEGWEHHVLWLEHQDNDPPRVVEQTFGLDSEDRVMMWGGQMF